MAEADCEVCEAMGYRSCDDCGRPTWEPENLFRDFFGFEWCTYCVDKHMPNRRRHG